MTEVVKAEALEVSDSGMCLPMTFLCESLTGRVLLVGDADSAQMMADNKSVV